MPGYELFGDEERKAVNDLFDANGGVLFAHGFLGQRKGIFKVREFEAALAKRFAAPHCQVVSSGSAALWVGLKALGLKPGDEVITSSFTFVATVEAILFAGAVPVLAEVDDTYNLDPEDVRRRVTGRTRAIVPVHMAGAPARMDELLALAKEKGLLVLEDAAQACGGTWKGKALGTLGDAGIYSFDFAKNLTTGEGGAVLTRSKAVWELAREYHDHGHQYNPAVPRGRDTRRAAGFNFRMTELQAAIGLAQLAKLDRIVESQRRNKRLLKGLLADAGVRFRTIADEGEIADTLIFSLPDAAGAAAAAARLAAKGVGTKNLPDAVDWHFAGTWEHMLRGVGGVKEPAKAWPRTADLLARSIALPVNVKDAEEGLRKTAAAVQGALRELAVK
ncbi:MAG: DegT/DnrJ/EryC1/StrS family aminotransferase [Elusimicrobia bacterium]|nr:DegT/DnrJ/EryC1/StrS family aminotransferase [Elusimicrobiota bacterium]